MSVFFFFPSIKDFFSSSLLGSSCKDLSNYDSVVVRWVVVVFSITIHVRCGYLKMWIRIMDATRIARHNCTSLIHPASIWISDILHIAYLQKKWFCCVQSASAESWGWLWDLLNLAYRIMYSRRLELQWSCDVSSWRSFCWNLANVVGSYGDGLLLKLILVLFFNGFTCCWLLTVCMQISGSTLSCLDAIVSYSCARQCCE